MLRKKQKQKKMMDDLSTTVSNTGLVTWTKKMKYVEDRNI